MILKPDKGQRIVLNNKNKYYNSLELLFFSNTKLEVANEDAALHNISTFQSHLNVLFNLRRYN